MGRLPDRHTDARARRGGLLEVDRASDSIERRGKGDNNWHARTGDDPTLVARDGGGERSKAFVDALNR
jgi:hypothetical protein